MAREVHTLTLAVPDWGKVAVAVQHELNRLRNTSEYFDTPESKLRHACEIANMARIKSEITNQRRAIRYSQKTDQSVSKR